MLDHQKLFGNYFDDIKITTERLLNFGKTVLNRLIAANDTSAYSALISQLSPVLQALAAETGNADSSLNIQKGATLTNRQVMKDFILTMRIEEPFIARELEGRHTPDFLQFYPQGISEYNYARKTDMPVLTSRVNTAGTRHAAKLGTELTARLQAFENRWVSSRSTQQKQMGTVSDKRIGCSQARTAVELALVAVMHAIGNMFPGNVEQCAGFFDLSLLFPQTRRRHQRFAGTLAAGETVQLLNRTLTDTATLTLRNTGDNAAIAVWLSATGTDTMPDGCITIPPAHAHEVKPSALGNLQHTFLLLHNVSEVNEAVYEVVVVG